MSTLKTRKQLKQDLALRCDYYVYILYDENNQPFYVGKGLNGRWSVHEKEARLSTRETPTLAFIRSMHARGFSVRMRKAAQGLTAVEAIALERKLVAKYGRINIGTGILTNRNRGGGGTTECSDETRSKLSKLKLGVPFTATHRANLAAALLGVTSEAKKKPKSEAHARAISASLVGKKHTDERRANISKGRTGLKINVVSPLLGRKQSAEHAAKRTANQKGSKRSADFSRKQSERQLGSTHSADRVAKMVEGKRRAKLAREKAERAAAKAAKKRG
jgi:hypothetical protein